jgi:eukaryotic-like serine/threonine-protein kinase
VLHQIGSGVLGPVFRAYDSQNDRLAAIKTFKLMLVPEDAARFAERLRAMVETPPAHRAIIRGVEAGLDRSTPFLALEYAPGESLDALLRQSGVWPIGRALPVLREIAAAIDASWATGTGHGALHPRDIFIAFGPTDVRVTGFGIGSALEAVGAKAPVRRPYSAPERGTESWDIRADVYSLGVVAFEMLSGQRPVGPDDEAAALVADLSADTRAAVRRVLAVAMAEAPSDRYESATAFVSALEDVSGVKHKFEMPPAPPPLELVQDSELPDETESATTFDEILVPHTDVAMPVPVAAPMPTSEPEPEAETAPAPKVEPAATIAAPPPLPLAPPPAPAPAPALSMRPKTPAVEHPLDLPLTSNPRPERHRAPALGSFLQTESEPEPSSPFPWAAVAAVFIAGLVLSGVVMYQWGWSRGRTAGVQEAAKSATPSPTPVDVASSPEPSAAPSVTPTSAAVARGESGTKPAASDGPPLVGRLVIQSVPAGALVMVDGRRRGETPLTLQVPLGKHEIQIARSGYVPATRRVDLTKKSTAQTVRVTLQRGPGEPVSGRLVAGYALDRQLLGAGR